MWLLVSISYLVVPPVTTTHATWSNAAVAIKVAALIANRLGYMHRAGGGGGWMLVHATRSLMDINSDVFIRFQPDSAGARIRCVPSVEVATFSLDWSSDVTQARPMSSSQSVSGLD